MDEYDKMKNMKEICSFLHEQRRAGSLYFRDVDAVIETAESVYFEMKGNLSTSQEF